MKLWQYVLKRVLQGIPLTVAIIVICFVIIRLAPGDPINMLVSGYEPPPEMRRQLEAYWGLDKPLHQQLIVYIGRVLAGNLGYSHLAGKTVLEAIYERMPATLLLMLTGLVFSSIIGVGAGVMSSRRPYSLADNILTGTSLIGYSVPLFWVGQILIITLALGLKLFPVSGMFSLRQELTGMACFLDVLWHLVLPAVTLSVWFLALVTRITRAKMMEVLRQDFIIMARAKGATESRVTWRHALRNALSPIVTVIGFECGGIFMGAVVTETVFGWPGMGRLMYDSIMSRDYPVVTGLFFLISVTVIGVNIIVDIIYSILDPRIRYT
jgi:peptide/nickel transport system permease protein